MSSPLESDLDSRFSLTEMERAGGSGLLLPLEDLRPVEAGEPDSDEVSGSWPPVSSDLGEAGASLGLRTGFSEVRETGELGDRGLETEVKDSRLSWRSGVNSLQGRWRKIRLL